MYIRKPTYLPTYTHMHEYIRSFHVPVINLSWRIVKPGRTVKAVVMDVSDVHYSEESYRLLRQLFGPLSRRVADLSFSAFLFQVFPTIYPSAWTAHSLFPYTFPSRQALTINHYGIA